jgi:rare lipoprotein A
MPLVAVLTCTIAMTACSGRNSVWSSSPHYGPRVVPLGQPVPKGGGIHKVGIPYRINGRTYVPRALNSYDQIGVASWYGEDFHGRRTANGEIYDMAALTAAHPTLPLPSYAQVTNIRNGRSVLVRLNDRGPYVDNRIIDLSAGVASLLQIKNAGTGHVRVQYFGPAPIDGNDRRERQFLAQQPWAGPQVAYANSPAKASQTYGGTALPNQPAQIAVPQYAPQPLPQYSADGNETVVRKKVFFERLTSGSTVSAPSHLISASAPMPERLPFRMTGQPEVQKNAPQRHMHALNTEAKQNATQKAAQRPQTGKAPTATPAHVQPAFQQWPASIQTAPNTGASLKPQRKDTSKTVANDHLSNQIGTAFRETPPSQTASADPKVRVAKPLQAKPADKAPQSIYVEAGVFRERALADKLATILKEIAPTTIEETSSNSVEILYRLRVGPFAKSDAAQSVVDRIRAAGLTRARLVD